MNPRVSLAMAMAVCMMLSGCNTMKGFGKDVSILGDKIEKKAQEKK